MLQPFVPVLARELPLFGCSSAIAAPTSDSMAKFEESYNELDNVEPIEIGFGLGLTLDALSTDGNIKEFFTNPFNGEYVDY